MANKIFILLTNMYCTYVCVCIVNAYVFYPFLASFVILKIEKRKKKEKTEKEINAVQGVQNCDCH